MQLLGLEHFSAKVEKSNKTLKRKVVKTLQVNLGKLCNQACRHCHVDAGPNRTENMNEKDSSRILELLEKSKSVKALDLTGGAPELNPNFRNLIIGARKLGIKVIDRCNLTVLSEVGQEDTAAFLANNNVEIVASLPCYLKENVDKQRGNGIFEKSITGLKKLNDLGYGKIGSGLSLNLVYNPLGAFLPPDAFKLEKDYKFRLMEDFGIEFNSLLTITNIPIHRFKNWLIKRDKYESYMNLLIDNFNPETVENVMCTEMISVGYDGYIYDCDFNQMLGETLIGEEKTIYDINSFDSITEKIYLDNHCYGCTAGKGSSCSGSLV